jgi:hypothetical protein
MKNLRNIHHRRRRLLQVLKIVLKVKTQIQGQNLLQTDETRWKYKNKQFKKLT